jgi:hypothetical protein
MNPTSNPSLAVIIRKKQTKIDLATYLHAACCSPVPSTFIKAIKNNHFTTWPGLDVELITKHLVPTLATTKGHLHQERQNLQSTKDQSQVSSTDMDNDFFPTSDTPNRKTNDVVYSITQFEPKDRAYMDLTGRFPYQSSRGNTYILVGYHYDANAILAIPIKNRTAGEITNGWKQLNQQFAQAGLQPNTYVLDNEVSNELTTAMTKSSVNYQLVPPHIHRANLAERAIQTFKNHFKATLATVDPDFPVAQWDRLIEQSIITLNLLRATRVNPRLSAQAYLFGEFDFNKTPLAPPGTKIISHNKPHARASWDPNGDEGWYIGPALKHYRCVNCYYPCTGSTRVTDTVVFFPKHVKFPAVGINDFLKQAAQDIVSILTKPPPSTVPSLTAGDDTNNALLQLADLLNRSTPPPPPPQLSIPTAAVPRVESIQPPVVVPVPRVEPTQVPIAAVPRVNKQKSSIPPSQSLPAIIQRHGLRPNRTRDYSYRHHATNFLIAQHVFNRQSISHVYNTQGRKETLDSLLRGPQAEIWTKSLSNELGRLANGNKHGVKATNTIEFISQRNVPSDRAVTYANFICDYRPLKSEKFRVRLVVGGDKLPYENDAGSPAASLLETKLLLNSVISDAHKGAKFMGCDLKDFFLATPMEKAEYMKIQWKYIPLDIREQYGLESLVTEDKYIYVKINKGMYGLKQAAVLAYNHLVQNLAKSGYTPILTTIGMWQHKTRRTKFCLCVDDFGVKYFSQADADHLLEALRLDYTATVDYSGKNFCGLTMNWNYQAGFVDIAMPEYVQDALKRFQHQQPTTPQYSPHQHIPIKYGERRQYAPTENDEPILSKTDTKFVQSVVGTFLYYARAIDSTMLPALNEISSQQSKPTKTTMQKCRRLLDYAATYPTAYVRFYASDMELNIETDAAYLVMPKARSRIAGYYFLGNKPSSRPHPHLNGAILVECKTLKHVVASAAEAECGGVFHNAQMALPIRVILIALGHPQPPTPIKTDNSTARGFVYNNINQKKSKSWDMRYYWLRDRKAQRQFDLIWEKGENNNADYFTKHHATNYHKEMRPRYVRDNYLTALNDSLNLLYSHTPYAVR